MQVHARPDAAAVAVTAAAAIAQRLTAALAARATATVALSGGSTPRPLLADLAGRTLDWDRIHVLQVDERVAPDGHPDRNWTMLTETLLAPAGVPDTQAHPMPVTSADLDAAADDYAALLARVAGAPATIDVVHLGIGADGHTASLVPGDPVLDVDDRAVALAGPYQGRRRMTLTLPALNAARAIVWQVADGGKAAAVAALRAGGDVPAARVRRDGDVLLIADEAALGVTP